MHVGENYRNNGTLLHHLNQYQITRLASPPWSVLEVKVIAVCHHAPTIKEGGRVYRKWLMSSLITIKVIEGKIPWWLMLP